MKTLLVLAALVLSAAALPGDRPDAHGAQVLRVVPEKQVEVLYLRALLGKDRFDFWREPRAPGSPVDIMAQASTLPELKAILAHIGLEPKVMISDVGALVDEQAAARAARNPKALDWTDYHEYDVINDWLDSLAADYPDLCTVEDVGTSYEGRTMKMLTLGKGGADKPGIFIDGGIHSREWISPATVTYMVNELVTKSAEFDDILSSVNFYVMPVINPDGYVYTFSDERWWRKTRSVTDSIFGCMGVDPNRNFDYHWNEIGSSSDPCSDAYAGPSPFSEVEMQVVRDQILKYSSTLKVYFSLHSYSQLWLYPWGYTSQLPADSDDLHELAQSSVDALTAVHGTTFEIGSPSNILYHASGLSLDWAKGEAGVKYSYVAELRDTGEYGFMLPPEQIIPSGEETFEALKVIANFIKNN